MAGYGKLFMFHGAFKTKTAAVRKEKSVHGFIRKRRVRGAMRYVVMTSKKRRKHRR